MEACNLYKYMGVCGVCIIMCQSMCGGMQSVSEIRFVFFQSASEMRFVFF